jgi:hypothetical protein
LSRAAARGREHRLTGIVVSAAVIFVAVILIFVVAMRS